MKFVAVIALLLALFASIVVIIEYTGSGKFATGDTVNRSRAVAMNRVQKVAKRTTMTEAAVGILAARAHVNAGDRDAARLELMGAKEKAFKAVGKNKRGEVLAAFDEAIAGLDSRTTTARLSAIDRLLQYTVDMMNPQPEMEAEPTEDMEE